jgi:hypothetical protein
VNDKPGINGESFKILLNPNTFKKGEILVTAENVLLEVISVPTVKYKRWYWKILNILSFGYFFNVSYTYDVKIKQDDNTNTIRTTE